MHVLQSQGPSDGSGPTLGPMIFVDTLLKGQPVKALVDTTSPVTIVFIKFLRYYGEIEDTWAVSGRVEERSE